MIDLIVVMLLTAATLPVVELTASTFRVVLGIIFILVFPGYSLMAALFPRRGSLGGVERLALSFVMSFALVSLAGLGLNYTPWGIRLTPILTTLSIMIFALCGTAILRRLRLPKAERFVPSLDVRGFSWGRQGKADKLLTFILVVAILGALVTLGYVIARPDPGESFTSFYILGPGGKAEDYPQQVKVGDKVAIVLGIENNENLPVTYSVAVAMNGETLRKINPIELADKAKWEGEADFIPTKAGENQRVEFILYRDGRTEPYLTLHLWLDVKE